MIDNTWTITEGMLLYLKEHLPFGRTILELGSGRGTEELVRHWKVYSVEHDKQWVGKVPESNYIHAPLIKHKAVRNHDGDVWYDARVLKKRLPREYDLLLVDGPCPPGSRAGFLKYFSIFKANVPIIFDDINRYNDWKLILWTARKCKSSIYIPNTWEGKVFGVINHGLQPKDARASGQAREANQGVVR